MPFKGSNAFGVQQLFKSERSGDPDRSVGRPAAFDSCSRFVRVLDVIRVVNVVIQLSFLGSGNPVGFLYN